MKLEQKKELKDLKKAALTEVKPQMSEEAIYQNLMKNLKKQGLEVKEDKK